MPLTGSVVPSMTSFPGAPVEELEALSLATAPSSTQEGLDLPSPQASSPDLTPAETPEKHSPDKSSTESAKKSPQKIIHDPSVKLGRVIVVTSGKGGVGKTTTTANIGTGLAKLGYKVVLVDTDIGLRNLDILMGLENRIVYNIVDVVEERCKLTQALVKDKRFPNLQLLAAAQTRDKSALNEEQMRYICELLKPEADFILLDCPAGIEQGFINATAGASEAIVVCTTEMSAVRDADRVIGLLEAQEEIKNHKLILNRVRPNLIRSNDMMDVEDVLDILSVKLLGVIPEDKDIIISTNRGEPIVLQDVNQHTANSLAGQAYRNIARRVAGEDVPLMDLNPPSSFIGKIKSFFGQKRAN
jgi:septum site-determining protein MinD